LTPPTSTTPPTTPPASTDERRPVPAIDPRIRARRIAVRRDRGRRRLHRFTVAGVVAALAAALVAVALSPLVDVDEVRVSGADRSGAGVVVAATGIEEGEPLVTLDAAAAEASVERLPWVEDASVRRSWPGAVVVDVVERRAVAAVLAPSGVDVALVDADGRVLDAVPVEGAGALLVAGLAAPGPPGTRLAEDAGPALAVATALPPDLRARVERVAVADGGRLELQVLVPDADPATVVVGDASLLPEKLVALATLLASVDLTDVATIDLRVPRAPALTRR
jgi:cell division protein FtsQ